MVGAVAEETVYRVLFAARDAHLIDGVHVYRGDQLPKPDEVIVVETALTLIPLQAVKSHRARVTQVVPEDKFPVRAVELEP